MRIELSLDSAATLRALPRAQQRRIAERIALLKSADPVSQSAEPFVIDAESHRLICVRARTDMMLVVSIEEMEPSTWALLLDPVRRVLRGWSGQEARRATRGVRSLQSMNPRSRRMRFMDFLMELRLVARALSHDLGILVLAVLALAVGIGLPTAMFGVVDAALWRGLPVEDATRIVHLERRPYGARGEGWGVLSRDLTAWREQQRSLESLEAFAISEMTVRIDNLSERHSAALLTPGSFELLRARAASGRTFDAEDARAGAPGVVVLGHALWRDRMAGGPDAIGRTILIDGRPHTVVGVMPQGFSFPINEALWLPYPVDAVSADGGTTPTLSAFGRLARGISLAEARAEFAVIAARMEEQWPDTNRDLGIAIKPFTARFIGENASAQMKVVLAAVCLVLIVACANVANLLLVRAVRRVRDMAVRAALGATRARLARHALMESLVLAVAGGAAGIAIGAVALAMFRSQFGWRMPYWADMRLDTTALLFAGGLSVAAAVLAGLIPALRTARGDLTGMLRDESRGSTGTRAGRVMRGLVVVELALSVGLLAVTGLLIRGMGEASPERLGIPWRNVLTARIALPQDASAEVRLRYLASLEQTLSSQPAAAAVALATALPAARANVARIAIEGVTYESADAQPSVRRIAVSDGFFNLFDAAPTRGRAFGPLDGAAGTPVAIVNGALRRSLFSGEDPIGSRIRIGRTDGEPWRTIVGVIPDIWAGGLDAFPDRNPPAVYLPIAQAPPTTLGVAVRVRDTQPDGFANALRAASSAVDPDVPLYDVATMADLIENNSWFYGMAASIFALCGAATLLLATVGLYGVIAFSVGQRKREFGIRLALGAVPQDILRLVLRSGTVQLIAGIFLGAALARILSGGLSSLLFGVQPSDPLVLGVTLVLLSSVAITAMALPALRAGRTDPVTALRGE